MIGEDFHKPAYVFIIVGSILLLVADILLSALLYRYNILGHDLNGYLWQPQNWASWTIGACVIAWQLAWVLYTISTLFRYTSYGYFYVAPGHNHPTINCCYCLGLVCHLLWVVLLSLYGPEYALIPGIPAIVFFYLAYGISCHRLYYRGHILQREGVQKEAIYNRLAVQNAFAIYASLCVMFSLLNIDIVLVLIFHFDKAMSAALVQTIAIIYYVSWFFMDNFALDKYLRYTFSPYLVFILYQAGLLTCKPWNLPEDYAGIWTVLVCCGTATASVVTISKIAVMLKKQWTYPLWPGNGFFVESKGYGSVDMFRNTEKLSKDIAYY